MNRNPLQKKVVLVLTGTLGVGMKWVHLIKKQTNKQRNKQTNKQTNKTRWWFQTFFIFTPIWGNDPIWPISDGLKPPTRKASHDFIEISVQKFCIELSFLREKGHDEQTAFPGFCPGDNCILWFGWRVPNAASEDGTRDAWVKKKHEISMEN